jgi:hypothetical protein
VGQRLVKLRQSLGCDAKFFQGMIGAVFIACDAMMMFPP